MTRIALIGAGNISEVHAAALRTLPGLTIGAVVDPNIAAAERLASRAGGRAFASVAEALAADSFDRAHVLVPPDLHAAVTLELLAAGKPTLVEKPLAASLAECRDLLAAAGATPLGVNQNFVHHPAFARLRAEHAAKRYGVARAISCIYHVPLRQLADRQFGHWMFRQPGNLLLEQLVHPLSQLLSLAGPIKGMRLLPGPAIEISPGLPFVGSLEAIFDCDVPVHLRFSVGESFPCWQITLAGSDGIGTADILANRLVNAGRTSLMEPVDNMLSGLATAAGLAAGAIDGFARYCLAMVKILPRSDQFYISMCGSLGAFHRAIDAGQLPALDGNFGATLVETCERIAAEIMPKVQPRPIVQHITPAEADIAVLGGTGFIGAEVVRQLVAAGHKVSVMARSPRNLPAIFEHPDVCITRGSIADPAAVSTAIATCKTVINLAHGGGGANYEAVRRAMLGGAETVADACTEAGVTRLIHVGSIASLYLGPQEAPITGATPPDPQPDERADYARAKAACDLMLLARHRTGLPVVILRPGVVVGEGTSPFHSGVGLYNNEQHCIGWNDGRNPLPFVLVQDVAAAILLACTAPNIEGRTYNLVGDVRPNAADYTATLGRALGRPLRYHKQSATWLWLEDIGKWVIKRATGRNVPLPSRRDFLSRGLSATFDCADAVRDLNWHPNADPAVFHAKAIAIHA